MRAFRAFFAAALAVAFIVSAVPASAEQGCVNHDSRYDPGKTEEGFEATLTAGCHKVHWTSNTVDIVASGTVSGTVRFKTSNRLDSWAAGFPSSPEGGDANRCAHYAVSDADRYANYLLNLPPGTEVTVTYRCW